MIYLQCVSLFVAVLFTSVNIFRACAKHDIPGINFVLQAIGITGFAILQWVI